MRKLLLASLVLTTCATSAEAALVFSQSFTGGTDSWTMAGGGTMTTQSLTSAFNTTSSALNFLIAQAGGDTDSASGSVSAWVKLPAATPANLFAVKSQNGANPDVAGYTGYSLTADASGIASLNQTGNSAGSLAAITAGNWTLVTLTVEKQSASRLMNVSLYLNGLKWGGQSAPSDTVIGSNLNGNAFTGLLLGQSGLSVGGLQVYDTVLSGTEVSNLYAAQVAVPEPSSYGLLGAGAFAGALAIRRRRRSC